MKAPNRTHDVGLGRVADEMDGLLPDVHDAVNLAAVSPDKTLHCLKLRWSRPISFWKVSGAIGTADDADWCPVVAS